MGMSLDDFFSEWNSPSACMPLHTSGSTGSPKLLLAEKEKMRNSARMTCAFLGLRPGDTALLCMPLDYIAGKMMVVRSIVCDLRLVCVEPSGHPLKDLKTAPDFAAMIPMQVFNSLQVPHERGILEGIKHLIIGGGAVDEALEHELKDFPNAVWSSYGMTETLSHIALRRLNGVDADSWYTPLDGITVSTDTDDCLLIDAPALCSGTLLTNDIARIATDGRRFRILGRKDNVICSGGIKIQIEDVERRLSQHLSVPYIVTKKKDVKFGEIVVLLVQTNDVVKVRDVCESILPKYWRPRLYIPVEQLPMTGTGKPARAEAFRMAETH